MSSEHVKIDSNRESWIDPVVQLGNTEMEYKTVCWIEFITRAQRKCVLRMNKEATLFLYLGREQIDRIKKEKLIKE